MTRTIIRAKEEVVHRRICDYIRMQYPDVIFNSDGAGVAKSKAAAGMQKMLRSQRGYPDLFIAEPRNGYHGLFLEIKREGTPIFLKNGGLTANPHVREQAAMLEALQERGYAASFAIGDDQAKELIDEYLR